MGNDDGFYNPHEKTIEYEVFFFGPPIIAGDLFLESRLYLVDKGSSQASTSSNGMRLAAKKPVDGALDRRERGFMGIY